MVLWPLTRFFFLAPLSKATPVLFFATKVRKMKNPVEKQKRIFTFCQLFFSSSTSHLNEISSSFSDLISIIAATGRLLLLFLYFWFFFSWARKRKSWTIKKKKVNKKPKVTKLDKRKWFFRIPVFVCLFFFSSYIIKFVCLVSRPTFRKHQWCVVEIRKQMNVNRLMWRCAIVI